jgi:leucine dehydrogenase
VNILTTGGVSLQIFAEMEKLGHEQVILCQDKTAGLKAIIAIHDTTLGPALGGCRMWNYKNEDEAIVDALRLSRGMTYKSAAAGESYGGGKSVIFGDPNCEKTEELFRAFGRFVAGLKGRFLTGTDVGTSYDDFIWAAKEGPYFVALPEQFGGSGDSSIITAYGVWRGMKATAKEAFGTADLKGMHIAVQGLGKVGSHLIEYLYQEGARVTCTDINESYINTTVARYPVKTVSPEEIYNVQCDIFSPNALGAILTDTTIPRLQCKAIAGAANNQLAIPEVHGNMLQQLGIVYAPDYVINAGGLIQVADELHGYNRDRAFEKAGRIYNWLDKIFEIARSEQISTVKAADLLVERRLSNLGKVKSNFIHREIKG